WLCAGGLVTPGLPRTRQPPWSARADWPLDSRCPTNGGCNRRRELAWALLLGSGLRRDEVAWVDFECVGDGEDGTELGVAAGLLQVEHSLLCESGEFGHRVAGETLPVADRAEQLGERHEPSLVK